MNLRKFKVLLPGLLLSGFGAEGPKRNAQPIAWPAQTVAQKIWVVYGAGC